MENVPKEGKAVTEDQGQENNGWTRGAVMKLGRSGQI